MKAAVFEDVNKLVIKDVPVPKAKTGEVVLKIGACAVCGTDIKILRHGHKNIVPPRVTGHELAGEITEIAPDVTGYEVGQRVAVAPAIPCGQCKACRVGHQAMCDNLTAIGYQYDGGFAEYMAVPEVAVRNGCVNPIPDNVSYTEAAIAEPLACCIHAQELMWVGVGNSVAIIGTGPIGCLNAMVARSRGATKILMMDILDERLKACQFVEADHYINSAKQDAIDEVMNLTDGTGADRVIVACASGKAQEDALKMVAKCGVVDFFGGLPKGNSVIGFDSNLIHYREFYVVGNHGSAPRDNALAIDLIGSGKVDVKPMISNTFAIEDTLKAIETAEKGVGLKTIVKSK